MKTLSMSEEFESFIHKIKYDNPNKEDYISFYKNVQDTLNTLDKNLYRFLSDVEFSDKKRDKQIFLSSFSGMRDLCVLNNTPEQERVLIDYIKKHGDKTLLEFSVKANNFLSKIDVELFNAECEEKYGVNDEVVLKGYSD